MSGRLSVIVSVLIFSFILAEHSLNAGDTARVIALSAAGISEEDISSASSKLEISLYDAFVLSVSSTGNLTSAGENVIQSKSLHSQAIGSYLPGISLNAERSFAEKDSGAKADYTTAYIKGKQPVISGLNEWTAIERTGRETAMSHNLLRLAAQQQLLSVAQKYYLVRQLQSMLETDIEIVELYRKIRGELARRVAIGKNRKNELIRTDGQISRLEAQAESITSQLETARRELALATGTNSPVSAGSVNLPLPSFRPDDIKPVTGRRLEVVIARDNLEIAGIKLNAALGGHLPSVYLEGNYRFYSRGDDTLDRYNISVVASLPVFEGGVTSARINQAGSSYRQAELSLAETTRAVEKDILMAYETWNSFIKQSNAYKKALESAERNYDITMNDYRLSLVTILDVISVLTELQQARNDYRTSVFALELSRIKLGVAINEFPGSGNSILRNTSLPVKTDAR